MGTRLELQALLEQTTGVKVYFQPPPSVELEYPCIIYKRDAARVDYADDVKYKNFLRYEVTAVDKKSNGNLGASISQLRYCSFERFFTADGLNHDVYNLFF